MIYRVVAIESAIPAGDESAEIEWKWPRAGLVRAYALDASTGALAARAGLGLAVFRRERELVIDDRGARGFARALATGGPGIGVAWTPFLLPVETQEPWIVQVRNDGGAPATPILFFEVTE